MDAEALLKLTEPETDDNIDNLIQQLTSQPSFGNEQDTHIATFSGVLWKKRRKRFGWKLFHVKYADGLVTYSKTPEGLNKKRAQNKALRVSYVGYSKATEIMMMQIGEKVAGKVIHMFSYRRHTVFVPQSEQDVRLWASLRAINHRYSKEEQVFYKQTFKEFQTLLAEKEKLYVQQLAQLIRTFQEYAFSTRQKGLRQGSLYQSEATGWTKRFFVLFPATLTCYERSDSPPTDFIFLRHSQIELTGRLLVIRTPVGVYRLRAKHESAAQSWYNSLTNPEPDDQPELGAECQGYLTTCYPYLEITAPMDKTPRQFWFKKPGLYTVGRSSTCDIIVEDNKVSRSHFQIQLRPDQAMLIDLGSNKTYVNKKSVEKVTLRTGDEIQAGDSLLRFCVSQQKKRMPSIFKKSPM